MLNNYIKTAFRNLLRFKGYSAINIFGLSIGIACCILILLYVRNELSYDMFHHNGNRIYRVFCKLDIGSRVITTPNLPIPFGPALSDDIPEISSTVRFQNRTAVIRSGENLVREEILFCDPEMLKLFDFSLIEGDPATVLESPGSLVLSRSMARKYFGEEDPVGREMAVRLNEQELRFFITGVAANPPENSSIRFDFLVRFDRLFDLSEGARVRSNDWDSFNSVTFVMLHKGRRPENIDGKLAEFSKKYFSDPTEIFLQPLTDIHLNAQLGSGGLEPVSDPMYSYILAGIAFLVLLIACINFMTISLGRSSSRGREVGIRKVLGAQRLQLFKQFWSEALLLSFFALIAGIALAEVFLPVFNHLAGKALILDLSSDLWIPAGMVCLMLFTGLLAGSYPALLLSRYRPVEVFKGNLKLGGTTSFGKWLVIVQFSMSIFLIIATLVLARQRDYLLAKNLGFNDDQVIVIPTIREEMGERMLTRLRTRLARHPEILNISGAGFSINRGTHQVSASYQDQQIRAYEFRVEENYLETLGIRLLKGRNFSSGYATDSTGSAIVNQALVRLFNWDDPLGKTFKFRGRDLKVIGVVKDYHFESLHHEIAPAVLHLNPHAPLRYLLVKISARDIPGTLGLLRSSWKQIAPDLPFEYFFLDNDVARQYESEQRWGSIVTYSSAFAVIISCLGLFGLTALSVLKRTKEIGVRKVVGASVANLAGLISREFFLLVLAGNIIAWPVARYIMDRWLGSFAYRVELSWWNFVFAGGLVLTIALLTVSMQVIKAARANPLDSLKYE